MAVCDLTTADFKTTQIKDQNNFITLLDEISRFSPAEIIVNTMMYESVQEISKIRERFNIYISKLDDEKFDTDYNEFKSNMIY